MSFAILSETQSGHSEIMEEGTMNFSKCPRSHCTPNGCRLATYEEAKKGREMIKEKGLLEQWDRVRLLDGWISGPGYGFQIENNFRGCMAYMLVINFGEQANIDSGTLYKDITLSKDQKEVALLLCTEDWNYEVVYWVLNSLSGSETMDPSDVAEGNIRFSDAKNFQAINMTIQEVAKKFVEEGPASEKAGESNFSDPNSIQEVLSGMIECVKEQEQRIRQLSLDAPLDSALDFALEGLRDMSLESTWLGDVVSEGGPKWKSIAGPFWNFISESFASLVVLDFAVFGIIEICKFTSMWDPNEMTTSEKNFFVASYVLYCSSLVLFDIMSRPLAGYRRDRFIEQILHWVSERAERQPERFNQILQDNAMWRCEEETGKYEVLEKGLIFASKDRHKHSMLAIDRLFKCGAKPGRSLRRYKSKTSLHYAAKQEDEMLVKCLLEKCDTNQRDSFVNARDDKRRTALHRATELGNIPVCNLLLDYGAWLDAQDECNQTVLHKAVELGKEEVIGLFRGNPTFATCFDLEDEDRNTPLDLAIAQKKKEVVAQLLWISDKPESYFSKVDLRQVLCQSLLKGYVNIVSLLLDRGEDQPGDDVDDSGRTKLHLATMCENEETAKAMVEMILEKSEDKAKSVERRDRGGRTVLHEAALKGHASLCKHLLHMNPNLINMKDKDGRNALYDAVQGNHENMAQWRTMYEAYRKRGRKLDGVIDRSGLTLLHVAAEEGRRNIVKDLHSTRQFGRKYIKKADFLGQTALHKAARSGDKCTVEILLENGANPFQERDCDGRTALHYVVQAKTGKDGNELTKLLLETCKSGEERLLFLWASAAGVGPADQNVIDPELRKFLLDEKERLKEETMSTNLLQTAASIGHTGMTKELLSRGCQIADIQNKEWQNNLSDKQKANVKKVTTQIEIIAEQGSDLPTMEDNLERLDYAHGLAALLLNPFIKPPIAVGISGNWGKGKSSLMLKTESILLKTVAQLALLPSSQLSSRSTSNFPGVKDLEWSKEGKERAYQIRKQLDMHTEGFFGAVTEGQDADSLIEFLRKFLSNYEPRFREIFKSVAAMDRTKTFTTVSQEQSVPAIITVQYNAWKYKNETEALAGMAVKITKEIESSMTEPQWLTTCFRNTWRKRKYSIWIEIIFPCLLAILVACSFTWIVWVVFDRYKVEAWAKTKYACVPAAIVVVIWILAKSVMGVLKPVSTQLMNYISFPDHTEKLGYQDRVISDITFLKDEIGREASKICTAMVMLWHLVITLKHWLGALSSSPKRLRNTGSNMKFPPASSKNLRIIVFVDDLDRCQESVILQVLAAINLVLAVCEINVVLGMDKGLIERAIMKKYGDPKAKSSKASKELADNYLQKIIQLPLDLPDPSEQQLRRFLERHMGLVQKESDDIDTEADEDALHERKSKFRVHAQAVMAARRAKLMTVIKDGKKSSKLKKFSTMARATLPTSSVYIDVDDPQGEEEKDTEEGIIARETPNPGAQNTSDEQNTENADTEEGTIARETPKPGAQNTSDEQNTENAECFSWRTKSPPKQGAANTSSDSYGLNTNKKGNNPMPTREMLFVTYSSGEWDAICHFQKLATDCRKLPRELKRFLNYHRLVWNILSINIVDKPLVGWQVQLISWIFICWEWKENMDFLIQDWCNGGVLKTLTSKEPSLGIIVEHFIEGWGSNNINKAEDSENRKAKPEEKDGVDNREQRNKDKKMTESSYQEDTAPTTQDPVEKESRLDQPEVDMKEEMRAIKEQLYSLEKSVEELKNTIDELKMGKGTKHVTPKNENRVDGGKIKQKDMLNWRRLRSALDKYDVTMEGIQAFQRFRFHCVPGHLQWPLPKQEWEIK